MPKTPTKLKEAIARHRTGQIDEAEAVYRTFIQSHPELAEPWHLLGVVKLQRREYTAAVPLFREALKRDPIHFKCLSNLGGALYQTERFYDAETELRAALDIEPTYAEARFNLGNVLMAQSRFNEAMECFDAVIKENPDHVKALINIGLLYYKEQNNREARTYFEKAHALAPDDFTCLLNLANILERHNDLDGAKNTIDAALRQQPEHPDANLFGAKIDLRFKKPLEALKKINVVLNQNSVTPPDIQNYHVKFQALEDLNRTDEAFATLEIANAKTLENLNAQGLKKEKYIERLEVAHKRLDEGSVHPGTSEQLNKGVVSPIFFVGFPRSGTTLFEQMLDSHPNVITTNEKSPLANILGDEHLLHSANRIDSVEQARLRNRFWQEANALTGGVNGRVLIETTPFGIEWLDIASRLFPDSRVVMIVRDPRDVCLSCLMQNFKYTEELANFLTLENTGLVYEKLMGLWLRQASLIEFPKMTFRYEDLVSNMGGTVRNVLDFIGLDWSDDILSYRDKAQVGHITTPSYTQVGDHLHNRSIGRWRRYERQLAPIMETLKPFVRSFGYDE